MFNRIAAAFAGVTAGLVVLFSATTPGASATPKAADDCSRVAAADHSLCERVKAQHAYGFFLDSGDTIVDPSGKAIVREVTHSNLSAREMHARLTAEARDYRAHVTAITVNLDKLPHRGCWYEVGTVDADGKPGGVQITNIEPMCKG